jgi:hypothetical protein
LCNRHIAKPGSPSQIIFSVFLFFTLYYLTSCFPTETDKIDELLGNAFKAIRNRDWEGYRKLTVTSADFILKKMKISIIKYKQTFAGSSLKPMELQNHQNKFETLIKMNSGKNEGVIDFTNSKYDSMGKLVGRGVKTTLNNVEIPYQILTLKVKSLTDEIKKDLLPYFVVVKWGDHYKILDILINANTNNNPVYSGQNIP